MTTARGGHDYAKRFPWIVEAARKRQQRQFIIDGEAVLLAFHGISDFDGLHSGKQDEKVQFNAFDILAWRWMATISEGCRCRRRQASSASAPYRVKSH